MRPHIDLREGKKEREGREREGRGGEGGSRGEEEETENSQKESAQVSLNEDNPKPQEKNVWKRKKKKAALSKHTWMH